MSESILDDVSAESGELQQKVWQCGDQNSASQLLLEHVNKLAQADLPSVYLQDEVAEWVSGYKEGSLAKNCLGKVTLLDFFTYCCINCHHILQDLRDLEKIYSANDGFVVVGVHCPKFDEERSTDKVKMAVERLNINHPVINDPQSELWTRLGIKCWPTLVLLDPKGKPILVLAGEGHRDLLFQTVSVTLNYYREKSLLNLNTSKLLAALPKINENEPKNYLRYPGKISINLFYSNKPEDPWMALSDSGNHRIIITDINYNVLHIVGGNGHGLKDGNFEDCLFDDPQGVSWLDEYSLIISDTGNHAIRLISIKDKQVKLYIGTGSQAEFGDKGGLEFCVQSLSSPWDAILYKTSNIDSKKTNSSDSEKRIILIANAGNHQIWGTFLDETNWWKNKIYVEGTTVALIGSGREENRNNRYPHSAGLAQPSGLALQGDNLFIADSESSTIRRVDMTTGQVFNVVGGDKIPNNLFAFGDIDGIGFNARLQHPLGVAFCEANNLLYIADTYNHKIKSVDISNNICTTVTSKVDSKIDQLNEPAGLCVNSNTSTLFIADTNNHRIVTYDFGDESCKEICLKFPESVKPSSKNLDYKTEDIFLCPIALNLSSEENGSFILNLDCITESGESGDLHLTPEAPQKWSVKFLNKSNQEDLTREWNITGGIRSGKYFPAQFEASLKHSIQDDVMTTRMMRIEYFLSLCEETTCFIKRFAIDCELALEADNDKSVKYNLKCTVEPSGKVLVNVSH